MMFFRSLLEGNQHFACYGKVSDPFGEVSQSMKHNLFGRDGWGLAVTLYVPTSSSTGALVLIDYN